MIRSDESNINRKPYYRQKVHILFQKNKNILLLPSTTSSEDRIESVKYSIISTIAGLVSVFPLSIIYGYFQTFDSNWQTSHLSFIPCLLLFGITYRYATRSDDNPNLKQGTIAAFALTRSVSMVEPSISSTCNTSYFPHDCGGLFHLFDYNMLGVGVAYLIESFFAYGGSAYVLEYLSSKKILKKMFIISKI